MFALAIASDTTRNGGIGILVSSSAWLRRAKDDIIVERTVTA